MKFLCVLAVGLALVAADDNPSKDTEEGAATQGRTGSKKSGGDKGNRRFFGGGIGSGHGNPGFGGSFGVNPGFGGGHAGFGGKPGFGGVNTGFGGNSGFGGVNTGFGVNPGFGGVNTGFGVNPGFGGVNTGFGVNPGFGGVNAGFGGGIGAVSPGFGAVAPPSSCRRWCRTPQGQAYCCETINQPESFVGAKHGLCPPVRPVCPPTRSFAPPASCSSDGACGGIDKCCFDTCLQQHTCKPPQGIGR